MGVYKGGKEEGEREQGGKDRAAIQLSNALLWLPILPILLSLEFFFSKDFKTTSLFVGL